MISLLEGLQSRQGDRPDLALRLWFVALALLVMFAAAMLNAALPLRLLDPRWLQRLIQAVLTQGFLPLIALVLLHLAVVLNPGSSRVRRRDRFSRLAKIAAVGFVLLIPLQLASTWGSLNLLTSDQQQQRIQGLAVVGQLRKAVGEATSHQDLERRLGSLNIPLLSKSSAADLGLPYPQRQQKLLAGLTNSERQLTSVPTAAPIPWLALIESSLRVAPTALALAAGFFVLGYGTGSRIESRRAIKK